MAHTCHATACNVEIPPTMWGCKRHWFMVPKEIRDRVWATYRQGQCDDKNPSSVYLFAARAAVIAVAEKEGLKPDLQMYDMFLSMLCTCLEANEVCPESVDTIHSYEWWDGTGPCKFCDLSTCPSCDPGTGEHV